MPLTVVGEIFVLLAPPKTPAAAHPEPTFATFDEATEQIASRTRLIHSLGDLRIAWQLHLGFRIHLRHDEGWRLTPDPLTLCFARKVGHFANKIGRSAFKRPK